MAERGGGGDYYLTLFPKVKKKEVNSTQRLSNFSPQTGVECPGNDIPVEFCFQISVGILYM